MPQVLGHRSRPDLARHTGTDSPPRAGFFVPIASAKVVCSLAHTKWLYRAG